MKPLHHMYFVAIVCPAELNKKILAFKLWMKDQFGCIVALRSPAHITLIPPFWISEDKEPVLLDIVSNFKTNKDAIPIETAGFDHFAKRVLFVAIKDEPHLNEIKRDVKVYFLDALGDIIKKEERAFHPHITIANRDMKPSDFVKAWEHFSGKNFGEKFQADTVSLLRLYPDQWKVVAETRW